MKKNFTLFILLIFVSQKLLASDSIQRTYSCHHLKKNQGVVFFLHGLLKESDFKNFTQEVKNNLKDVALIFPKGEKNLYVENEMLSWGPNNLSEQIDFIKKIFLEIKKNENPPWMILAGYSNAAYVINHFLLQEKEEFFDGYWLQGCGMTTPASNSSPRAFVLSVGEKDFFNIDYCENYATYLKTKGFEQDANFVFRKLKGDHSLDLSFFQEDLFFLNRHR